MIRLIIYRPATGEIVRTVRVSDLQTATAQMLDADESVLRISAATDDGAAVNDARFKVSGARLALVNSTDPASAPAYFLEPLPL